MEPIVKVTVTVTTGPTAGTLPGEARDSVREALQAAATSKPSNIDHRHQPDQAPPSAAPPPQQTAEALISALQRAINQQAQLHPNVGGGNVVIRDALMDAMLRLAEHGYLPGGDGTALVYAPSPSNAGARAPSGHARRDGPDRQLRTTPERPREETRREGEPHAREQAPADKVAPERAPSLRTASPAEQRIREVIEKAVVRYLERSSDIPANSDRSIAAKPEAEVAGRARSEGIAQGAVSAPPAIDRERTQRPPDSILNPAIREVLNDPRNDTARLLQQILAPDAATTRATTQHAPSEQTGATPGTAINQSLTEVRTSINERLSHLRDALQTTIERSSPQPATSPERIPQPSHASVQQGDFTRTNPANHYARPVSTTQFEGRGSADGSRVIFGQPQSPSAPTPLGHIRPAGYGRDEIVALTQGKANGLLDAIGRAVERIASLQTLRTIDQAAETAVITAAAAIALGVIGGHIALKEILSLANELLRRLRGENALEKGADEEIVKVEELVREIEELCADRGVETIEQPQGMVADIPGVVRDEESGLGLEGVEIDAGPYGTTITNHRGEFLFQNIPVGDPFCVGARHPNYTFFPSPAIGTVSPDTYLSIFGRKVASSD